MRSSISRLLDNAVSERLWGLAEGHEAAAATRCLGTHLTAIDLLKPINVLRPMVTYASRSHEMLQNCSAKKRKAAPMLAFHTSIKRSLRNRNAANWLILPSFQTDS